MATSVVMTGNAGTTRYRGFRWRTVNHGRGLIESKGLIRRPLASAKALMPSPRRGVSMGRVVEFPEGRRLMRGIEQAAGQTEPAHIIILPVVRIERHPDEPSDGLEGGGSSS